MVDRQREVKAALRERSHLTGGGETAWPGDFGTFGSGVSPGEVAKTSRPRWARPGTLLTLSSTPLDASDAELAAFREAMSSMEMGWGQTLESLAGFLSAAR